MRFLNASRRVALATGVAAIACAGPASAEEKIAPPGNSGVNQYFEVVPTAKGDAAPANRGRPLPSRVLRPAQHSRPGPQPERVLDETPRPRRKRAAVSGSREESPLRSVVKSLSGDEDGGGMGLLLPALLVSSTTVLAIVAMRRRRKA